jgi:hypothetical protein
VTENSSGVAPGAPLPAQAPQQAQPVKRGWLFYAVLVFCLLSFAGTLAYKTYVSREKTREAQGLLRADSDFWGGVSTAETSGLASAVSSAAAVSPGEEFWQSAPRPEAGQSNTKAVASTVDAFAKYKDVPVVKQFMAEIANDPELKALRETTPAGDPRIMMAKMGSSPAMRRIAAKYARNKEFVEVMQRMSADLQVPQPGSGALQTEADSAPVVQTAAQQPGVSYKAPPPVSGN